MTLESDGSLGSMCIYQATNPEAIRKHAKLAELPLTEIVSIADTAVIRPDL